MASSDSTLSDKEMIIQLQNRIKQLEASKKKQQQKAQKKRRTLKHYYESILSIIPGHVYWLDKNNRYVFCNNLQAQTLHLLSNQAIVGKTNFDFLPKAQADLINETNNYIMQTGQSQTQEEPADMAGKSGVFLSHKVPLYNEAHEVVGIIGVSLDITQQKNTEKALAEALEKAEAANRAKSAFIANMSHDIRTPLAGIIGMSQLLAKESTFPKEQQYAHWINESGHQLLNLLNNILEMSSAENSHETELQETTFSLRECLEELVALERPTTLIRGLAFQLELDAHLPEWICADRVKLHRIILNLVGNAVKFTNTGFVKVQVIQNSETETHATLTFLVIDSGIGIPKALHVRVFDRFFRGNPSDQGIYTGNGVGLHVVQSYVQLLGGTISFVSEEGLGTTFSFQLTFKKASPPERECDTTPAHLPSQTHHAQPFLLLIEDNVIALKLLTHLTASAGFPYLTAPSAEVALDLLKQHKIDVIITDLGLPGLSGIELTQKIRKSKKQNQPIIIGLTAYAPEDITQTCLAAGMNAVLTKPVDFKKLEATFRNLIQHATPVALGQDLPATEAELFELSSYPILDVDYALKILGSSTILKEMLSLMLDDQLLKDLSALQEAYSEKDWNTIESLAHKMKAGAIYCGTRRMHIACQYLERYRKAGHCQSLESLYQQLLQVLEDTQRAIREWIG